MAFVDAVGILIGLLILQVPLAIPLAVLVFLLAFIPIVGAVTAGALAALVALVANGPVIALIVVANSFTDNQTEAKNRAILSTSMSTIKTLLWRCVRALRADMRSCEVATLRSLHRVSSAPQVNSSLEALTASIPSRDARSTLPWCGPLLLRRP